MKYYNYMEQHPVPQNVTSFQFRLIGDMTIKQFGYLAGGVILGYISIKLPLPFFIRWPLAVFFGLGGFGLAFVPVEERPMDVWVLSFFKSIYSPTQYIWRKNLRTQTPTGVQPTPADSFTSQAQHQITGQPSLPTQKNNPFEFLKTLFEKHPHTTPPAQKVSQKSGLVTPETQTHPIVVPGPSPRVSTTSNAASQELSTSQKRIRELEASLQKIATDTTSRDLAGERVVELQKQLTDVLAQKEHMEHELEKLRKKLEANPGETVAATTIHQGQPTVRVVSPGSATQVGLPRLTTFPNVTTGIVKDHEGNLLPGVLITIRDTQDTPLRALKTNKLGQFAASTPLPNGTYLVEVEDPRQRFAFDRAQITLSGEVVPALEIRSKAPRDLNREKLEKELFGTPGV